jgi:hypothetical protein
MIRLGAPTAPTTVINPTPRSSFKTRSEARCSPDHRSIWWAARWSGRVSATMCSEVACRLPSESSHFALIRFTGKRSTLSPHADPTV